MKRQLAWMALVCGLAGLPFSVAHAQAGLGAQGCGSLENAYGPYDYRTDKDKLGIVEKFHFGPAQESLSATDGLGGDLDYTLRAFPNHHRALMAMMKLGAKEKRAQATRANYSVECYMIRAESFRPDDAMVKVIYGLFLMQSGRAKGAIAKLEAARELDTQNANVHYNLGLAYADLNQYDKALESAHRAYGAGFPLPGLKNKLKRAGKWREP
ncbi:MAG: hypothetical protein PWP40_1334 [Rhodocyclaceae bacterium]|nr:hypothetical protein [Rhodocyclaceae bacterium]